MDITLVGGGLAGLTISALLARAGHKVEMLVSDDVGRSRLGQPRSINLALSASLCHLTANLPLLRWQAPNQDELVREERQLLIAAQPAAREP